MRKSLSLNFRRRRKKANVFADGAFAIVVIAVFALVIIFGRNILSEMNTDLQNDADLNADSKEKIGDLNTRYPTFFDSLFVFVFVLIWILVAVASFFIDSSPMFFAVAIILIAFLLYIGFIMANTFEEVADSAELSNVISDFPKTNFIMLNIDKFILLIAITIAIVLYGKSRLDT